MNPFRWLGFLFLALAAAGVFLPVLPTTPFVLLAAACFARSSPRWHAWILANPAFGPLIRDWEARRCVTCRVKLVAITSMVVLGGASVYFALETATTRGAAAATMLLGLLAVLRLRTCPAEG